ncbi:MAG: tRNA pseudouridine(38-40) synthase TruA [Clostridiales bacterium]|jgi:tRNA pseudouridine38-40 synthase|nr:tRNA pseudouridine(38-40) synthase TruA [Clostridiales bacterium]
MRKIKLIIAYDGTNYSGWQRQNNAITVEEVVTKAVKSVFQKEIEVVGASRTDAGVHAYGQVATISIESELSTEKIIGAINAYMPEDIRIHEIEEVPEDFHPRFAAKMKTYEYTIVNNTYLMPQKRLYAHFMRRKLDVVLMQAGANHLIGEHDFKSFCSIKTSSNSTVRTIYDINVKKVDDTIIIQVTGNAFLYNMIRIIAGTLIEVGYGRLVPDDVKFILEQCDRQKARKTAPAKGLTLMKIEY